MSVYFWAVLIDLIDSAKELRSICPLSLDCNPEDFWVPAIILQMRLKGTGQSREKTAALAPVNPIGMSESLLFGWLKISHLLCQPAR